MRLRFLLPLILLAGCGGLPRSFVQQQSTPPPTTTTAAPTATLSASPSTIQQGQSTKLTWNTTNAGDVTINGIGAVGPQGSIQVAPTATATYELTARGSGGTTQASAHVIVTTSPSPTPSVPTASLSVNPSTIQQGQSTKLTWNTTNAGNVTINGIGTVRPQGSIQVAPTTTATYQLTARGSGGTTQVSAHVTVTTSPPAPTASLSVSPNTIQKGQSARLTWSTTNAGTVTIGGVGTVGPQGSQLVTPTATTTYQLRAQGSGGTKSTSVQLTVTTMQPPHVVLIIEENRSFSTVYPTGMPWMSALGNLYGIATNYYSDEAGSMLDYLWLSSGSGEHTFGCAGWGCLHTITDDNIFRELNRAGLSWKVYAESLPYPGFMGTSSGSYVKRHNPAAWYSDVVNSPAQQQKMVPFTQFAKDLASNNLPNYSVVVPNLADDAHSGTIGVADQWLKTNIGPLLSSPYFKPGGNGVLFITFDNGDADAQGLVFTGVIGGRVIAGKKVSLHYRHENTLRTVMELLGLTHFPGASATASPMNEFFK